MYIVEAAQKGHKKLNVTANKTLTSIPAAMEPCSVAWVYALFALKGKIVYDICKLVQRGKIINEYEKTHTYV